MALEQPDMQGLGTPEQAESLLGAVSDSAVSEVTCYDVYIPAGSEEPEEPAPEVPALRRWPLSRQAEEVPVITGPNDLEETILAGARAIRNLPETFRIIFKNWRS